MRTNRRTWGESEIWARILNSVPTLTIDQKQYVKRDIFLGFLDNVQRAILNNDASFLTQQRGIKTARVVDVEEFVESKEFFGLKSIIRPRIKYELIQLFHGDRYCVTVICTGGTGIGKGFFGQCGMGYCLYLNSILWNPQLEYGIAPGSAIYYAIQAPTERIARRATFNELQERIKLSPYFQKNFMFDKKVTSEMRFPQNIRIAPFSGSDTACFGLNIWGGIIDEVNFMAVTEKSKQVHGGSNGGKYDQAERVFNTIDRRMKGRFHSGGAVPGKLFVLSSVNYPGDFTDRKLKEAETDESVYVMKLAQWESIPEHKFCGEKFLVEVGDEFRQSRIIQNREQARDQGQVKEIPVEYLKDFQRDIEGSLKDYAGISVMTKHIFIPYREELTATRDMFNTTHEGHSLFKTETVSMGLHDIVDFDELIDHEYLDQLMADSGVTFVAASDIGVSGDAAGFSIGHVSGYKTAEGKAEIEKESQKVVRLLQKRIPLYTIDGALKITAPKGQEVDLNKISKLVEYLSQYITILYVSADSYQSVDFLQDMRKLGIRSGILSVDTNSEPYMELKNAARDLRFFYASMILYTELTKLEREGNVIDHPADGSKDVADSSAAVVYLLKRKVADQESRGRPSRRERRTTQNIIQGDRKNKRRARRLG